MTLLGLSNSSYFLGIFSYYLIEWFLNALGSALIAGLYVFTNCNGLLIFLFIFFYNITFFPYAIIIVALFNRRVVANSFALIGYILAF